MKITIKDDFDLKKIAESGQCFRFNECETEPGTFSVAALDKHVFVKELGNCEYEFSCDKKEFDGFWKNYFDLELSYADIRGRISKKKDIYLYNASEYGKGIRILRQDPWEMLISFIISQRKNIPAIKASIEKLCAMAGDLIVEDERVGKIYSFPTPEKLAALSLDKFSSCSLGYRDKYVKKAAEDVASGLVDLSSWDKLSDEELMEELLKLFGVGVKVANCEILFGYHRLDAFPKDVWINRVLDKYYKNGIPKKYNEYIGIIQQCWFNYAKDFKI